MEYKNRLIESQLSDAFHMAQWIDASPHEWPTYDKIPHLCYAILDLWQHKAAAVERAEKAEKREAEEEQVHENYMAMLTNALGNRPYSLPDGIDALRTRAEAAEATVAGLREAAEAIKDLTAGMNGSGFHQGMNAAMETVTKLADEAAKEAAGA